MLSEELPGASWGAGPNKKAVWHCACVIAWQFWNAPSGEAVLLRRLQARRCGQTGRRLWKSAEVDHRVPLFRVWREYRDLPWPKLLDFWGLRNLQVINRDVHVAKCANEARDRRAAPSPEAEQADREPAVAHVRPRRCVGDYGRRPNCSATSFSASKIGKDRLNAASAS